MKVSTPHYELLLEASRTRDSGRWRFAVRTPDGAEQLAAADVEPHARGARLDLLTVVRGLEALDGPARVTLIGCSGYVRHGIRYGLPEWRSNGWQWELFGQMVPVKNGDLWQRLDRALRFHQVECRQWRFDAPHALLADRHLAMEPRPDAGPDADRDGDRVSTVSRNWVEYARSLLRPGGLSRIVAAARRRWRRGIESVRLRACE